MMCMSKVKFILSSGEELAAILDVGGEDIGEVVREWLSWALICSKCTGNFGIIHAIV